MEFKVQIVMYTYDYDASICLAIVYDMMAIINRTYRIQKVYRHLWGVLGETCFDF